MALANCKECGHQISTKAVSCPKCGRILPKPMSLTKRIAILGFTAVVFAAVMKSMPETPAAISTPAKASAPIETEAQKKVEREKRLLEIQTTCTTELPTLLSDVKTILAAGDSSMAIARLNRCDGVSVDPSYLALRKTAQKTQADKLAKIERENKATKRREGVRIGMSKQDVLDSSWGKPERVNTTTNAYGSREQWVYGSGGYLYFSGDSLTTIQN